MHTFVARTVLACMLCVGSAHAAIMGNITGAAWPTSGTATTGSTGFDVLTGTWTHVGSANIPTGSSATGYMELATGASGTFRIDSATAPFTVGEDHWVRFWVNPSRDLTKPQPLDSGFIDILTIMAVADPSAKLRLWTYVRNAPTTAGSQGLSLLALESMAGSSTALPLDDMGGSDSPMVVPYDTWTEIVIHIRVHATDGRWGYYVNGVAVMEDAVMDTTSAAIATADIKSDWAIQLGGIAGLKFRVAGPFESWSGTDIVIRPRYDLEPTNSYQTKMFLHHYADTVYTQGRMFAYSGTATQTPTSYTTPGGVNPQRRRMVVSGTVGQTAVITTIDALGDLPYNEDGWATVFFSDFYLPGVGTTCDFILRNATDTADIARITYDGTDLKQGSTILKAALAKTSRWKMALHLHTSGAATFSLIDETSPSLTTPTYFSGPLANWVPQSIGKAGFSAVYGTASFELGAISVHRWLEMAMLDSLSTSGITGLTPEAQGPAQVSAQFAQVSDSNGVPNIWRLRHEWVARGYGRRGISALIGRGGLNRAAWNANVLSGMAYARGVLLWHIDGGSINDIGSGLADQAAVDAKVVYMAANLNATLTGMLASGANRVLLTTMVRRERGSFNAFDLLAIDGFNIAIRAQAQANPSKIFLADVANEIAPHRPLFWGPGDDVHPSVWGAYVIATRMIRGLRPADPLLRPAVASRPLVSR